MTEMFAGGNTDKQRMGLDLMGRRRMASGVPVLLKAARSGDAKVRPEAIKMVGDLGGADQLPALLELLENVDRPQDLAAAEQAIATACTKAKEPQAQADKLIGRLSQAKPAQQAALLRVLAAVGGPNSLKAVRAAIDSDNAEVRSAAIRALGSWRTADAAPDLLDLAETTSDSTVQDAVPAKLPQSGRPRRNAGGAAAAKCASRRKALSSVTKRRRLLLGTLSNIESPDAMGLILPYLSDAGMQQEAGMAAVTLAEKLLKRRGAAKVAAQLVEPLEKVAQTTTNDEVARRAKALLEQAQNPGNRKQR